MFQFWSVQRTIADSNERNETLRDRNEALHARVKELKEGREALEESARNQLGFIKDGEIFYRIVPEPKAE